MPMPTLRAIIGWIVAVVMIVAMFTAQLPYYMGLSIAALGICQSLR